MPKPRLRFIGDVHADFRTYRDLITKADCSVQVGDFCSFGGFGGLDGVNAVKHRILAGNHDICDPKHPFYFGNCPHFLGDFGTLAFAGFPEIFYIRGAFSIDGVRFNEELDQDRFDAASELYMRVKPKIVVTHQSPSMLIPYVGNKVILRQYGYAKEPFTLTGYNLDVLFNRHQPRLWVFGHYHKTWTAEIDGCRFVALDRVHRNNNKIGYYDTFGFASA